VKLRTLTTFCLIAIVAGILLLGAFSLHAWQTFNQNVARIETLSRLDTRVAQFQSAIDYVTLVNSDPSILESLGADARQLADAFRELNHWGSAVAVLHLTEMAHLTQVLAEQAPNTSLLHGDTVERARLMEVTRQLLVHRSMVMDALNSMVDEHRHTFHSGLARQFGTLIGGGLTLALLSMLGFALMHRRLRGPLTAVETGMRAIARGDLDARIRVQGRDELAELGGLFNDMVEQRQAYEAALREQEERFRQLAENIDEVFWMTDPVTETTLYVSPAFEHIWERSCQALHDRPETWLEAIHEEDRARVAEAARHQAEGGYQEEYRIVRPDGTMRIVMDRAFPVRNARGEVYRVAGVAVDVTHMRQMEIDLRERVKELRALYRILELTADPTRPTDEICRDVAAMLPEGLTHPEAAVARVVIGRDEYLSPGWRTPAALLSSTITHNGAEDGYIEVGYTELPDEAMRKTHPFLPEEQDLLDGVAGHLWRMLHTRRMMHTLSQSERLSAVGQLTGGVAHDFNNLLTVIIGNAELLQLRMDKADPLRGLVDMIGTASQRGAELTQRLLAFSRHQALEPRVIDTNEQLRGMTDLLSRALGGHIEIRFILAPDLWPALVDPGQLENALLNLCINARDAMDNGGFLTIETVNTVLDVHYAETHLEINAGEYVMLSVTDTGSGIPPEILDRVFEPFFTTKGPEQGTGLGLSMVHGFVKQSGGHVSIYTEPGQGTTVRLYLPRATEGDPLPAPEPSEYRAGNCQEVILLVEDNRLVRRYAREQLGALGYTVITADNARDALDLIRQNPDIDLLFTDVVMPGGMNGRELAEAARVHCPGLKVLYTSGYTRNAIVHHGRLDPGVQLLVKPYRQADLARKVRETLDAETHHKD
jgi:PAS domain S-box-containing protein